MPAVEHDATVESTPLHGLHNASVLTDGVSLAMHCDELTADKHLTMLFEGQMMRQRLPAQILLDTSASVSFVSPSLLKKLNLAYLPVEAKLRLATNSEAPILGRVKLKLKIQQFVAIVPCLVTDLCADFGVIL